MDATFLSDAIARRLVDEGDAKLGPVLDTSFAWIVVGILFAIFIGALLVFSLVQYLPLIHDAVKACELKLKRNIRHKFRDQRVPGGFMSQVNRKLLDRITAGVDLDKDHDPKFGPDPLFQKWCLQKRIYAGIAAEPGQQGCLTRVFGDSSADYLWYMANHQPILSCFSAAGDNPVSRNERRTLWLVTTSLSFFFYAVQIGYLENRTLQEQLLFFLRLCRALHPHSQHLHVLLHRLSLCCRKE